MTEWAACSSSFTPADYPAARKRIARHYAGASVEFMDMDELADGVWWVRFCVSPPPTGVGGRLGSIALAQEWMASRAAA
jgi:hypothetical protein